MLCCQTVQRLDKMQLPDIENQDAVYKWHFSINFKVGKREVAECLPQNYFHETPTFLIRHTQLGLGPPSSPPWRQVCVHVMKLPDECALVIKIALRDALLCCV